MFRKEISIKVSHLIIISIIIFIVMTMQKVFVSDAQEEAQDFRVLLEELKQLQENEPSLLLFFQLVTPLPGMDGDTLTIPSEYPEENETWLGRIGDNYVCFYTRGGQAVSERCVPFTNIASVIYLAGP